MLVTLLVLLVIWQYISLSRHGLMSMNKLNESDANCGDVASKRSPTQTPTSGRQGRLLLLGCSTRQRHGWKMAFC